MAEEGLKVFTLAYKDIKIEEMADHNDESLEFRNLVERDLTYLCTFGFTDTLRDSVIDSIFEIQAGASTVDNSSKKSDSSSKEKKKKRLNVRMVSGDHVLTARRVAIDAGLLDEDHPEGAVMTAA